MRLCQTKKLAKEKTTIYLRKKLKLYIDKKLLISIICKELKWFNSKKNQITKLHWCKDLDKFSQKNINITHKE